MGCFDYRCCVTGLPIRAGDPIKYILLAENPYDKETIISMHDCWFLRTWPLRAEYNDYGSIENFDETSPGVWAVVEGLKKDLVEVGTGDNSVHDVPTKKGMGFDDILTAVGEARILVSREYDLDKELRQEVDTLFDKLSDKLGEPRTPRTPIFSRVYEPLEGLPTLARIRSLLEDNGFRVNNQRDYNDQGFLVDELDHGWVRIRPGGFGSQSENLGRVLPLLQEKYAAMITAGSGSYSGEAELQVMPHPDGNRRMRFRNGDSKTPLRVCEGMILGSAWDAILQHFDYKKIRSQVQAQWDHSVKPCTPLEMLMRGIQTGHRGDDDFAASFFHRSEIPFTMGLGEHMALIQKRHREQPFTDQQIQDFLDDVAGLACLYRMLMPLHYWWKPSWYGGQGSRYEADQEWHMLLAGVSEKLQQQVDEENKKWDQELAEEQDE